MLPVVSGIAAHPPPDLPLQPADGRGRGRAVAAGADRPCLWRRRGVLSLCFVVLAAAGARQPRHRAGRDGAEKRLFAYSVIYLFALFAALVADRWLAW